MACMGLLTAAWQHKWEPQICLPAAIDKLLEHGWPQLCLLMGLVGIPNVGDPASLLPWHILVQQDYTGDKTHWWLLTCTHAMHLTAYLPGNVNSWCVQGAGRGQ